MVFFYFFTRGAPAQFAACRFLFFYIFFLPLAAGVFFRPISSLGFDGSKSNPQKSPQHTKLLVVTCTGESRSSKLLNKTNILELIIERARSYVAEKSVIYKTN